jgi:hypothetical protein
MIRNGKRAGPYHPPRSCSNFIGASFSDRWSMSMKQLVRAGNAFQAARHVNSVPLADQRTLIASEFANGPDHAGFPLQHLTGPSDDAVAAVRLLPLGQAHL